MRKQVNRVLAALLIGGIALVMVMTLAVYGRNYAYGFFKSYTDQLTEDSDLFDNVAARVYKLNYNTEKRLWGRDALRHLSAKAQMLPGKQLINIAGYDMIRLSSGGWYTMAEGAYDPGHAKQLTDYAQKLYEEQGIRSILSYCHCALFEDGLLPKSAEPYDNNNEYADLILQDFASAGVAASDSRETYKRYHLTMDTAVNKSDLHWTHLMALYAAWDTVKELNAAYDLQLDEDALDPARFTCELHPGLLSGEFARRIGDDAVAPDDVYVLYPAYDTHILYEERGNPEAKKEGSFEQAVLNRENLSLDPGKPYSTNAYYIYGHYLAQTRTYNESAPECTVLVFKDSFGSPLSAFLGLAASNVYAVDLRSTKVPMEKWVELVQPDVVVFAYSEQTFRNVEVEIGEQELKSE